MSVGHPPVIFPLNQSPLCACDVEYDLNVALVEGGRVGSLAELN